MVLNVNKFQNINQKDDFDDDFFGQRVVEQTPTVQHTTVAKI